LNYFAETQEMLKLLHLMNYLKEPNLLLNIKKTNRWRASFQLAQPQTLPKKIGRNPKNKRAKKKGGVGGIPPRSSISPSEARRLCQISLFKFVHQIWQNYFKNLRGFNLEDTILKAYLSLDFFNSADS